MFEAIGNLLGNKPKKKKGTHAGGSSSRAASHHHQGRDRRQTFSKAFHWCVPGGHEAQPGSVELIGSFTDWKKVPLVYEKSMGTWHVRMPDIIGNRTHHYVVLVDGKPTYDATCDGLAIPQGPKEEQWQMKTARGPRVMMLFGQTK
jgi:hypothetical protein